MNQYSYEGPVMMFDTCIQHIWKASTYAVSEKKAKSNLMYQFKKHNNMISSTKISLPGKIVLVS